MQSENNVVHEYDIRGIFPGELSIDMYRKLGIAMVNQYKPRVIAVGYDVRKSSPQLFAGLVSGITSAGCQVYDLGLINTEVINFVSGYYPEVDLAAVVTASHNPKEYNGLKLVSKLARPISATTGLQELYDLSLTIDSNEIASLPGQVTEFTNFWNDYRQHIVKYTHISELSKTYNIIVDPGNGAGGYALEKLFNDFPPINHHLINAFPNGDFPFHEANPAHTDTLKQLELYITEHPQPKDFGVAFDADADRIVFIDINGQLLHPYYLGILLAEHFLKNTNSNVLYDNRLRMGYEDLLVKYPGRVLINKSGRSNFYHSMQDKNAAFAAEASGHYYYADFYTSDSAFMTLGHILKMIDNGLDLSAIIKDFQQRYYLSGEVNYIVDDPDQLIAQIKEVYIHQDCQISEVDGVEVTNPQWALNIRKSNTQPLVRLNVEARDKSLLIQKFREVEGHINSQRENNPILAELN